MREKNHIVTVLFPFIILIIPCCNSAPAFYNLQVENFGECDKGPSIENARVSVSGSIMSIICNRGYLLVKENNEKPPQCNNTQLKWTNVPQCLKSCGTARVRPHLIIDYQSFEGADSIPGSIVRYRCERGYFIYPNISDVTCGETGKWQIAIPICVPIPDRSSTSTMVPAIGPRLWKLVETCLEFLGTTKLPTTTEAAPKRKECITEPSIENGAIFSRSYSNKLRRAIAGDSIIYQCNDGYSHLGTPIARSQCDGSSWVPPPSCQLNRNKTAEIDECQAAPEIPFADSQLVEGKLVITCNKGYELSGNTDLAVCDYETATWLNVPTCQKKTCGPPPIRKGVLIERQSFRGADSIPGSIVSYTCESEDRQITTNFSQVVCLGNGQWSPNGAPYCSIESDFLDYSGCEELPNIANAEIVVIDPSTIKVVCNRGYVIAEGTEPPFCAAHNGTWQHVPLCVKATVTCGAPPQRPHLAIEAQNFKGSNSRPGSAVKYRCAFENNTVKPGSSAVVKCGNDGKWSPSLPSCFLNAAAAAKSACSSKPEIPFGKVKLDGKEISVVCDSGYYLQMSSDGPPICDPLTGNWTALPTCRTISCGFAPLRPNLVIKSQSFDDANSVSGSTVTYGCASAEFEMTGDYDRIVCLENRRWSREPPTCVPAVTAKSCGEPPCVGNGVVIEKSFEGNRSTFGSIVRYQCSDGYTFSKGTTLAVVCLRSGEWTQQKPTCTLMPKLKALEILSSAPTLVNGRATISILATIALIFILRLVE